MMFSIADKWLIAGVHLLHCVSLFAQQTRHAIVDTQTHRQLPPQCELDWNGGGCSSSRHVTMSLAGEPVSILGLSPSCKQRQPWKRTTWDLLGQFPQPTCSWKWHFPSEAENLPRICWVGVQLSDGWVRNPEGFWIVTRDNCNRIYNVTSQLSIATVVNRGKHL